MRSVREGPAMVVAAQGAKRAGGGRDRERGRRPRDASGLPVCRGRGNTVALGTLDCIALGCIILYFTGMVLGCAVLLCCLPAVLCHLVLDISHYCCSMNSTVCLFCCCPPCPESTRASWHGRPSLLDAPALGLGSLQRWVRIALLRYIQHCNVLYCAGTSFTLGLAPPTKDKG